MILPHYSDGQTEQNLQQLSQKSQPSRQDSNQISQVGLLLLNGLFHLSLILKSV